MQVKDNKQQQRECNGVKYIYVINLHDYFESFQSNPKIVIIDFSFMQQHLQTNQQHHWHSKT
jgi:hypothetical protein